jgi:hypothetical protein
MANNCANNCQCLACIAEKRPGDFPAAVKAERKKYDTNADQSSWTLRGGRS